MMERWQGKVAVVTGASSGIGAAISKLLATNGMKVVGIARRVEKIEELVKSLPKEKQSNFIAMQCDVSDEDEIKSTLENVERNVGRVQVLVNNAGTTRMTELVEPNNTHMLKEVIDVNVMGVVWCTREVYNRMRTNNLEGHIIVINSIAGHQVLNFMGLLPSFNIYPATKFAISSIVETLRMEFGGHQSKVKITVSYSYSYIILRSLDVVGYPSHEVIWKCVFL